MSTATLDRLKRPKQTMPEFVRKALEASGLAEAYAQRPPYQRNDYLWWIKDAKGEDTRDRRLQQMLDELRAGDVYMKMRWRGSVQR